MPLGDRRRARWARSASSPPGGWTCSTRPDGVTVIDDSYNANPSSTAAALRALAAMAAGRPDGGRARLHGRAGRLRARPGTSEVGRLAAELGVDRLLAVGEAAPDAGRRGRGGRLGRGAGLRSPIRRRPSRPCDLTCGRRCGAGEGFAVPDVGGRGLPATRGGTPREGSHRRGRGRLHHLAVRHPDRDPGVHRAQGRASRSASIGPQSHMGKKGTPTMGGVGFIVATVVAYVAGHAALTTLPERQIAPGEPDDDRPGAARAVRVLRRGRLPGRLPQGPQAQLGRPERQGQTARPADRRASASASPRCTCPAPTARPWPASTSRSSGTSAGWTSARSARCCLRLRDHGDVQRREPHRRPRRPGHRRLDPGAGRVLADRVLAVPALVR